MNSTQAYWSIIRWISAFVLHPYSYSFWYLLNRGSFLFARISVLFTFFYLMYVKTLIRLIMKSTGLSYILVNSKTICRFPFRVSLHAIDNINIILRKSLVPLELVSTIDSLLFRSPCPYGNALRYWVENSLKGIGPISIYFPCALHSKLSSNLVSSNGWLRFSGIKLFQLPSHSLLQDPCRDP